ncbi:hypothetical protein QYE76_022156 [Lolium multiflorum]|uniref:Gag-pol polyprotein n=1 Tax=Lolium multiflorum TaxID=4521 RepID=A0AAD8VRJ7_LOLMU|nr:hypothetical protein QYE76_022156 [Lolium multiflorum]
MRVGVLGIPAVVVHESIGAGVHSTQWSVEHTLDMVVHAGEGQRRRWHDYIHAMPQHGMFWRLAVLDNAAAHHADDRRSTGCDRLSFLDAYSGYNQIKLKKEDQELTAFITPHGVFCYNDEDIPTSLIPPSSPIEDEPVVKLKSNEVRIGPMTRARAKLLKQQVNLFLNDTLIDENFVLPKSYYLCIIRYEEETSIARGGEEQLDVKMDVKLDMELDMKISHGRAREEREECEKKEVQAGPSRQTDHAAGPADRPPTGCRRDCIVGRSRNLAIPLTGHLTGRASRGSGQSCLRPSIMCRDNKIVNQENKNSADIITWREYEALRNEMRREFRTKDDELKGTVDEIKQTLDATNVTVTGLADQMTDIQRNIADMRLAIENLTAQQQQDDDEDPELEDDAHNARGAPRGHRPRGWVPLGRNGRGQDEEDGLGKPKFSIPKFEGGADVEEYLTWELKIEKLWSLHPNYSEDRKIKLASSEFDGYALRWWDSLVRNLDEDGAQPIRTWRAMKEAMTSCFVPTNYMRNIFDKLTLLRQGVKTVDEYYMEMEMLMQRGRVRESLEMTMQRFQWIEKQRLRDVLRELGVLHPAPSTAPAPSTRSAPYSTPPSKPVSNVSNAKKSESATSTSGSNMSTARNRDMLCHTCGGKGHFKRDCPNRKVMFINEDNEYETGDDVDPNAPDDDDYDTDGEDAYPSDARTIVVSQRALNVLPSASTQRCNLFQTKALVGPDKACKVIIDGGSCRNLASKGLCTKLKLKYLRHPHPYYIQWLSDNGEMKVNHMVRVEFEIGPYKDCIDFDVVPMTEFGDVFPEEVPAGLPPLRGIEHQIDLIPGASLPNRAPYRTNPEETKEIQKQVQALLDKGYIRISLSPCVVPVILVPKKDGTWRMCVDCRAINNITIRYRHPIPRLEDMLDELSGAAVFSKIDLRSGYHQIRMKEGDEWKTAFKTKFGLYEWLVMPFGLTNAPNTFMRLMNHVLREFIGKFVVVYFDDILIYSRNESDHTIHIRHVLQVLRDNQLYGNLEKCTFCKDKVIFLGYVVSKHGVEVDVSKIEAIQNWPTPMNVSQVRSFHGLAGFYRRFVPNFSTIAAPLNDLTKKGVFFEWGAAQDHAFDELKRLLTSAPLLALPDFNKQFEIECDASGIGIGGVLMQEGRPIAYFSEKLSGAKLNYPIYDKELYALIRVLEESHAGGLMGHFGREKTLLMLADHFYWPNMRRDVDRYVRRCITCNKSKSKLKPHVYELLGRRFGESWGRSCCSDYLSFPNDGQTEVVNRTLSQLLRSMIKKNLKEWEECLPHVEFAYNRAVHSTTELCPFEVVYGFKPITPLDLLPLPIHERVNMEASKRADFVKKIHVKTKELIEKKGKSNAARLNKKRKEMLFKHGDLVWVHFRKDRFPKLRKSKLKPRGVGPYKVLAKINDNAYSIDLPEDEFGVSNSFNVADLTPYDGEDLGASGRRLLKGGDDEDIPTSLIPPSSPIEDEPASPMKYEEETSIARGGEEQLDVKMDVKLDMELDMKISHGRARKERNAREKEEVQAGPEPGPATTLGAGPGPSTGRQPRDCIVRRNRKFRLPVDGPDRTGRPTADRIDRTVKSVWIYSGATYQRCMQAYLGEQMGRNIEVYIDDIVVKTKHAATLIDDLRETFDNLDRYKIKLNPKKCFFGVPGGQVLGYFISARGIEANPLKIKAILDMEPPKNLHQVQQLAGRLAALSRFIAKLGEKALPFYQLMKKSEKFGWTEEAQESFDNLKKILSTSPKS